MEMPTALVSLCIDPRLNHELLRTQVAQHLRRLNLHAERIYLVNDVGGNVSTSFEHALDMLVRQGQAPVFAAVLHHDDCLAEGAGLRAPMAVTALEIGNRLSAHGLNCPVHSGHILTETNHLIWDQAPDPQYRPYQAFAS